MKYIGNRDSTLHAEEQLLTWSVARVAGGSVAPCPSRPDEDAPWEQVEYLARWHRLLPLIHHLASTDPEFPQVPDSAWDCLDLWHKHSVAHNMLLRSHLTAILTAMSEQYIPVIVLKGISLEEDLYPHIGLRLINDIDLMVPESGLPRAERVLASLGFVQVGENGVRSDFRQNHHHLAPYVHRRTGAIVDLHWRLISPGRPYQLDGVDGFWQRAQEATVGGVSCLVLAPEDRLLHLCLHFLGDRLSSKAGALLQVCDISLLLNSYKESIHWGEFTSRALDSHVSSAVYMALHTLRQITGVTCPEVVYARLRPADFDERKASLFIRRRVIGVGWETPKRLVNALSRSRAKGKLGRNAHALRYRARRNVPGGQGPEFRDSQVSSPFFHLLALGEKLKKVLSRPTVIWEQVVIDRWLAHSLNTTGKEGKKAQ